MPRNAANYNENHLSRSQIFIFDYGRAEEESDDCDSADDGNMYFSSRLRGQRISFDVVDSGWQRREDADSISTVLSWKFSLHDDGSVPEDHIIRWRILQKRHSMNEKCTVSSTVLCTKGIRPENNKKRSKDSSLFTIHSSTKRVSSGDSEILADFHWESKSQDSASSANFELIAYRQRSPMFRQFDLLINGTSFFELPEFEKKWHPSPPRSPGIIRRNRPNSKQSKVHPAASRRPSRSLSPTHSYSGGTKTFHRKVHSLAVESPICVFKDMNSANTLSDCSHKVSMSYIDQLMINSDFHSKDEKAIEADALHFTYLFASEKVHAQELSSPRGCANRYEFIRKTLSEMINLVVLGKLNSDVASRIVHCAATMVGFAVMVPMSNIVLLLSIPDHEDHCTLSTKLRCYGEIENLVLASGNRQFGVCTFRSGTDAATAIRASCRGELNIKVRNLEFAFQNCELEGNYSSPLQHTNEIKDTNSLSETVKQSNKAIPKPNAKLPKTLRERTFTLEGYRDSALDAFRRGVENSVKDCECMLNRAITMALLDNNSAPGACQYSPKIEQDANFLSTANEMRLASKTLPERAAFLEDAVFQLASLVRRRTMKPEQATNIIHECASLLDLPLFRPLRRPCIVLNGIKENCSFEELETCLKQYGEIDEIGFDSNRNGFVRWSSATAVEKLFENLENIPAAQIIPASFATAKYLNKQQIYSNRSGCNTMTLAGDKSCVLLTSPSVLSGSTDISCDSVYDEEESNQRLKTKLSLVENKEQKNRNGTSAGAEKKEKSSSAFSFQKYKKWISKTFVGFLSQASDKSRALSSMQSIRDLLVVNIDDEQSSRRDIKK